jgi:drug/metabolite transporter (DMT)-like permease
MAVAYAALVFAVFGVSWSAIFIRWAEVPGPSSAFYRVSIAAAILVPWCSAALLTSNRFRARVHQMDWRTALLAVGGGAFFAIDLALYNTAVLRTTATSATLLGNNAPIVVGIGTWLVFRRRPHRAFWMGLALALAGAVIVVSDNARRGEPGRGDPYGDLLALAASVFFAAYLLATERVREQLSTLTFSTLAIVGSALTLLVVCLIVGAPLSGFSPRTWGALLGLGLVSQLAAYFALAYALGHLPATTTSVGLLAQVPLTALLALPLLGEPVRAAQGIGAALVLTGIYIVIRRKG